MLGPILKKKAIWRAELPPDTVQEWEDKLKKAREVWGRFFHNDIQCDLFNMLPISDEDRVQLLNNMIRDSKLRHDIESCDGALDTCKEHRALCIACVSLKKTDIAKPFY